MSTGSINNNSNTHFKIVKKLGFLFCLGFFFFLTCLVSGYLLLFVFLTSKKKKGSSTDTLEKYLMKEIG